MDPIPRERSPWWVKLGLWPWPSRAAVWAWVWISLLSAAAACGFAAWASHPRWWAGLLFLVSALMYWLTIRWVDRHGSWQSDRAFRGTTSGGDPGP